MARRSYEDSLGMQDGVRKHTFQIETVRDTAASNRFETVRIGLESWSSNKLDLWLPSLGPSEAVWGRFACDDFQWHEFCRQYHRELQRRGRQCESLRSLACRRPVVLTYRVGDDWHNVAVALKRHLEQLECKRRYDAGWIISGLTWAVRDEIQRFGGLWFARHKAWTMPDRPTWQYIQSLLPGDF